MRVRGASLGIAQAVTLRAAVENRGMRFVCRNPVGGEAHDEDGLGWLPPLLPLGGFSMGGVPGVGVGVGLSSTGVEEGLSAGVEVGILVLSPLSFTKMLF